jgi:hypothetical protein
MLPVWVVRIRSVLVRTASPFVALVRGAGLAASWLAAPALRGTAFNFII